MSNDQLTSENLDDETLSELIEFRRTTLKHHTDEGNKTQAVLHNMVLVALLELQERRKADSAEPVYQWREAFEEDSLWDDCTKAQYDGFAKKTDCEVRILYTTPPAPTVLSTTEIISQLEQVLNWILNTLPVPTPLTIPNARRLTNVINTCRAAMLQAGTLINEGTIPATRFQQVADLYGITSPTGSETSFTFDAFEASGFAKDGWSVQEYVELERYQAAVTGNSPSKCSLREGIETIRNSGISVDVDKIQPECDAGSSPVSPDGWILVSERMPERDVDVQVYCADKKEQMVGYMERNETEGWFRFASLPNGGGVYCKPTHWMPLPAAPQQEVIGIDLANGKDASVEVVIENGKVISHG